MSEKYKQGYIAYNPKTERYGFLVCDLWTSKQFHCGEHFQIYDNGEWKEVRIEFDWKDKNWYLVGTEYKGNDIYLLARV